MTWAMQARQDFIAGRLMLVGRINRADISAHFGVSTAQASVDLRAFKAANPDACVHNMSAKTYIAGPRLAR